MQRLQAYKVKLKPNKVQKRLLDQYAGCCRKVYNLALDLCKRRYERQQKHKEAGREEAAKKLSYLGQFGMGKRVKKWRKRWPYLQDPYSQSLGMSVKHVDLAYKSLFRKHGKMPRFKKRGVKDSVHYYQGIRIDNRNHRVYAPKLGWIRYFKNRPVEGTPKNLTFTKEAGEWFASIQTEREIKEPVHPEPDKAVAVHLGVNRFYTLSTGLHGQGPQPGKKLKDKLTWEQRKLSRKKKHSKNFKKQNHRLQKLHRHIANIRKDHHHKLSHKLTSEYGSIFMEDLKIQEMTKTAKGTVEEPGKNVKVQAKFNRYMLDQGLYAFRSMMEYKQAWKGGKFTLVEPTENSRTCHKCGHSDNLNRDGLLRFSCISCGYQSHADDNASINLYRAGYAQSACEEGKPSKSQRRGSKTGNSLLAGTEGA